MTFKRFFVFALMAAALLLSSCTEDYDVNTNIYPALAEIGPQGGQLTTTFVSNGLWNATSEDAGVSFTPDSGIAGTWTLTVTIPASNTDVEKTYKVKIQAKYGSDISTRYFTVTQHPK